jgi:hypothetical protein
MENQIVKVSRIVNHIQIKGVVRNELDFYQDCIVDGEVEVGGDWKKTNDYPNYIAEVVSKSTTARACFDVFQKAVIGNGLKNSVGKLLISESENLDSLLEKVNADFSLLYRFAVLVKYKIMGETITATLHHLNAEFVRYGLPTENGNIYSVIYNPYFNTSEEGEKKQWIQYPLFDESRVAEDLEWFLENNQHYSNRGTTEEEFGQVYFYNITTPLSRTYSRPSIDSADNAMQAEALLWEFHKANLRNNGYGGGIITIVGDPDAPIEVNARGEVTLTAREAFEAQLQDNTLGAENAGAFTVLWLTGTNPILPKIEPFANSTENDTRFLNLAPVIKEAITTAWGVPSILANIQEAGKLGNTQEIELAIMRMNDVVKPFQTKLESCLNTLLHLIYPLKDVEIIPTSPILEIPQWIFDNLSPEAKNEYIERKYGIKNNAQNVTTYITD